MAQVGFPRLFSVHGAADPRWDFQGCFPSDGAVTSAKAANPNLIVMQHPQSFGTFPNTSVTYGAPWASFAGVTDTVTDGSAANVGVVRPHNSTWDVIRKTDGTPALSGNGTSGVPIWNLANWPVATGIEDTYLALAKFIIYRCKQNRLYRDNWAGYISDNWMCVYMGGYGGLNFDHDRNGVLDGVSMLKGRFGDGLYLLGKFLRDSLPGMIVGGNVAYKFSPWMEPSWSDNMTDPDAWLKYANLAETEDSDKYLYSHAGALQLINTYTSTVATAHPTTGGSQLGFLNYPDPYGQERYGAVFFQLADTAGNAYPVPANYNSPSVYKQEIYYRPARKGMALACCAGCYYFPCFIQQFSSKLYYDDEMLGGTNVNARNWMGQPVAAATSPATNVFLRQFEDGLAIVNVGGTNQTVTLPGSAGSWRKIAGTASHNDGGLISGTTFTIPAHDGRLLVREGVSPPIAQPPVNTVLPTVSGSAVSGQALTPTYGTWLNTPTSYSVVFARYSGGTRLATLQTQSTLATYTLVAGDVGFTIRVEVVATNADGSSPTALSLATAVVQAPPEVEPSDVLGGPGSVIRDFTVGSESLPSSIFPASGIRDFALSPSIVGRLFKRIYGPALIPNLSTAFYTVLNGRRLIIRHIHVSNPSASPVDFTLAIGTDSPGTRLWDGQPVQADSILQHFRDHTLNEGETLLGFAGTNNVLTLTVDGYEESIDISQ